MCTAKINPFLLIRHTDLDGFAAGASVVNSPMMSGKRDSITDIAYNYKMSEEMKSLILNHIRNNATIFIVDISISKTNKNDFEDIIEYVKSNQKKVYWFDHHASSIDWVVQDPEGREFKANTISRLTTSRSGAYITYQELFNIYEDNEIPDAIRFTDDYDRWVHAYSESVMLNDATFMRKYACLKNPLSDEWSRLIAADTDFLNEIIVNGTTYHEIIKDENESYYRSNHFKFIADICIHPNPESDVEPFYFGNLDLCKHRYLAITALNRIGNSMLFGDDYNRMDACLTFASRPTTKYSMYSSNANIKCNSFMSLIGGGGHAGAAGAPGPATYTSYSMLCEEESYFEFTHNLSVIPHFIIPDEFGGGFINYGMRINMTEAAAAKFVTDDNTVGNKLVNYYHNGSEIINKELNMIQHYYANDKMRSGILHYNSKKNDFVWLEDYNA